MAHDRLKAMLDEGKGPLLALALTPEAANRTGAPGTLPGAAPHLSVRRSPIW